MQARRVTSYTIPPYWYPRLSTLTSGQLAQGTLPPHTTPVGFISLTDASVPRLGVAQQSGGTCYR